MTARWIIPAPVWREGVFLSAELFGTEFDRYGGVYDVPTSHPETWAACVYLRGRPGLWKHDFTDKAEARAWVETEVKKALGAEVADE